MSTTPNNVVALAIARGLQVRGIDTKADLASIAATINNAHLAAHTAAVAAVDHARIAGAALLQAKALVAHGNWLPWLETNCPTIARRTAQAYMQLADACEKSPSIASELSAMPVRKAMQSLAELKKPKAQRVAHSPAIGETWAKRRKRRLAAAAEKYVGQIERAIRSRRNKGILDEAITVLDADERRALEQRLGSLQQSVGRLRKKLRPLTANGASK